MQEKERGQSTLATIFTVIIFVLIAGTLVDVYSAWAARNWAYRAASSAALRGVTVGRNFNTFYATGQWSLDAVAAQSEAASALAAEMAARGITGYSADIRVLPAPTGGTISGYPPIARAHQAGGDWSTGEPSVGVYISVPVRTFFLNMVNGGADFQVHAFAAAGLPH